MYGAHHGGGQLLLQIVVELIDRFGLAIYITAAKITKVFMQAVAVVTRWIVRNNRRAAVSTRNVGI